MKRSIAALCASAALLASSPSLFSSPGTNASLQLALERSLGQERELVRRIDLDGDGVEDLALLHADGKLSLFQRERDGSLSPANQMLNGIALPRLSEALWQDADLDGDIDLFAHGTEGAGVYLRNDSGLFVVATAEVGLPTEAIQQVVWVDADADGDPDLVTVSSAGTALHENEGNVFTTHMLETSVHTAARLGSKHVRFDPGAPYASEAGSEQAAEVDATFGVPTQTLAARPRLDDQKRGQIGRAALDDPLGVDVTSSTTELLNAELAKLCADSLADQSGAGCIKAGSTPAAGRLFPLGIDLFVEPKSRWVGIGTMAPNARLQVAAQPGETAIRADAIGEASAGLFSSTGTQTPALWGRSSLVAGAFQGDLVVGRPGFGAPQLHTTVNTGPNDGSQIRLYGTGPSPMIELRALESATQGAQIELANFSGVDTLVLDGQTSQNGSQIEMMQGGGERTFEVSATAQLSAGSQIRMWARNGNRTAHLVSEESSGTGAQFEIGRADGQTTMRLDAEEGASGATFRMLDESGREMVELLAHEASGQGAVLSLAEADGTKTIRLDPDNGTGAKIAMNTSANEETVSIVSQQTTGTGARLSLRTAAGQGTFVADAETSQGSVVSMLTSTGEETVEFLSEATSGTGSRLAMRTGAGTGTFIVDAEVAQGSELSMRTSSGQETFEVLSQEGPTNGAQLVMRKNDGTATIVLDAETSVAAEFSMRDRNGNETVEILSDEGAPGGGQLVLRNGTGEATIVLDADQGGPSRIRVDIVEISGGDLVEDFNTGGVHCEPGTVLAIDPASPGALLPSTTAYDRRVAGIVSGAGDVRAGLCLGQSEPLKGDTPVALTGRVYVRCNTENGPIEPGDMLTTSSTTGVAMRASDPLLSFGAVIGKALTTLAADHDGEALVLVLVSLQ